MKSIPCALGLALALGGAALANSPVESDADRALCEERGGEVMPGAGGSVCSTPTQNAECARKNGASSSFDYQTGACGEQSTEAGATQGGWTDVN